jgi:anti-anti-sigma factor
VNLDPAPLAEAWSITRRGRVVLAQVHVARLFDPALIDRLDRDLRATITEQDEVVLDLGAVRFISSAMLGRMVMLWLASQRRGRRVVLCGITGTLGEILRIAGLHQRVEIFADGPTALAALGERP